MTKINPVQHQLLLSFSDSIAALIAGIVGNVVGDMIGQQYFNGSGRYICFVYLH